MFLQSNVIQNFLKTTSEINLLKPFRSSELYTLSPIDRFHNWNPSQEMCIHSKLNKQLVLFFISTRVDMIENLNRSDQTSSDFVLIIDKLQYFIRFKLHSYWATVTDLVPINALCFWRSGSMIESCRNLEQRSWRTNQFISMHGCSIFISISKGANIWFPILFPQINFSHDQYK